MRSRVIISLTVIFGVIVLYFLMGGVKTKKVLYFTPSDVVQKSFDEGDIVRIMGKVEEGSLIKNDEKVTFKISDLKNSLIVVYKGLLPPTFIEGGEVVVEGKIDKGQLEASTILVKCPSKYRSKLR